MKWRQSIRWRIQAWHGLLLLAVIAGFCITAYRLEHTNVLRNADHELELRLASLSNALTQGGPRGGGSGGGRPPDDGGGRPPPREGENPGDDGPPPDEGGGRPSPRGERGMPPPFRTAAVTALFNPGDPQPYYFVAWSRSRRTIAASTTAPPGIPQPEGTSVSSMSRNIRLRGNMREAFLYTPPGECLLVGRSVFDIEREMRDFTWKLAGIGGAVLVFGLLTGWWIASRAIRPIAQISAAATRIAEGNLHERIRTRETESELGRLASLLDDTFQRLDAAFDEQARFTSDAAHELRTPVSIILGQTQLALAKDRSTTEYRDAIETCQRAARRMHGLIESLLELAVLDAGETRAGFQPVDLKDIALEQAELITPMAEEKSIRIAAAPSPAPCSGDFVRLSQIVANLLTNAVKYCQEHALVSLETRTESGVAVLEVRDTGPGIAPEHLPHLFERFYRADASRNRTTGGAGLGLAISKRIATAHGGTLEVASEPGTGTVFTLRIPPAA